MSKQQIEARCRYCRSWCPTANPQVMPDHDHPITGQRCHGSLYRPAATRTK